MASLSAEDWSAEDENYEPPPTAAEELAEIKEYARRIARNTNTVATIMVVWVVLTVVGVVIALTGGGL